MKLELLGETSIPEAISYIDNGYVYVGKLIFILLSDHSILFFSEVTRDLDPS